MDKGLKLVPAQDLLNLVQDRSLDLNQSLVTLYNQEWVLDSNLELVCRLE